MRHHFFSRLNIGWMASAMMAFFAATVSAKTITDVEAKLVILHGFISHYANWPGNYALNNRSEILICSVGSDEVVSQLKLMEKASTPTLTVRVVRSVPLSKLSMCHAVYIAENQTAYLSGILQAIKGYPVLSISPIRQFVEAGGMVGLETEVKQQGTFEKHFVRYSLNLKALSRVNITVHPDALELAKRVVKQ